MILSNELKAEISKNANLRDWFGYKDRIMGSPYLNMDLKLTILAYGMCLMLSRFGRILD